MPKIAAGLASALLLLRVGPVYGQAMPAAEKPKTNQARAQPPEGKAPQPTEVQSVVITGQSTAPQISIDRRSYDLTRDLHAKTGSVADALRGVPSVEVDVQGNVSLRGDTSVTILIDGRPSGLLQGSDAGQALQQLPANQFERVEVMTNPSAAVLPDGSGGVINLISVKVRRAGNTGSVQAAVGGRGRGSASLNASTTSTRLTASVGANYSRDVQKPTDIEDRSRRDPVTGQWSNSHALRGNTAAMTSWLARGAADFDLDSTTRLSGEARESRSRYSGPNTLQFDAPLDGGSAAAFARIGVFESTRSNTAGTATVRHTYPGADHELVAAITGERTREMRRHRDITSGSMLAPADRFQDLGVENRLDRVKVKVDYSRPLSDQSTLKLGLDLQGDDNLYANFGVRGPDEAGARPDLTLQDRFVFRQTTNDIYGTYERPIDDLTLLVGLRLEFVSRDFGSRADPMLVSDTYFKAFPSLHLAYRTSDTGRVTASYSRRLTRPQPQELNPFRVTVDPLNFRQGNPGLKPQDTDSFELGYEFRGKTALFLTTLYFRQTDNGVADVLRDLGQGMFLTVPENITRSRNVGLELVANGRLSKSLSYNVSGGPSWSEILGGDLGDTRPRATASASARGSLDWQATSRDLFQINASVTGKRLTLQGYRKPSAMLNLGYRHDVTDDISVLVTLRDALASFKDITVIETPGLQGRREVNYRFRAISVGLTYTFGGGTKPRGNDFDYGIGGGAS